MALARGRYRRRDLGFVRLWRTPQLRFLAVAATLVVVYVLAWIPGKPYYSDGTAAVVLAAGAAAVEGWVARGARPRLRRWLVVAAPLVGLVPLLPGLLPVLPIGDVHDLTASEQRSTLGDTIGWPQLASAVAAQDAALVRAGHPPTSIFTGTYAEAATLQVLGTADHLPPVAAPEALRLTAPVTERGPRVSGPERWPAASPARA
jgi:hypothetical protein